MGWPCEKSDDDELGEGDEKALGMCERSSREYGGQSDIPLSDSSLRSMN